MLEVAVHADGDVELRRERASVEPDLPVPRQQPRLARFAVAADGPAEARREPLDLGDGLAVADRAADAEDCAGLLEVERRRVGAAFDEPDARAGDRVELQAAHLRSRVVTGLERVEHPRPQRRVSRRRSAFRSSSC